MPLILQKTTTTLAIAVLRTALSLNLTFLLSKCLFVSFFGLPIDLRSLSWPFSSRLTNVLLPCLEAILWLNHSYISLKKWQCGFYSSSENVKPVLRREDYKNTKTTVALLQQSYLCARLALNDILTTAKLKAMAYKTEVVIIITTTTTIMATLTSLQLRLISTLCCWQDFLLLAAIIAQ